MRGASRSEVHSGPFWAPGHTPGAAGPRVGRRGCASDSVVPSERDRGFRRRPRRSHRWELQRELQVVQDFASGAGFSLHAGVHVPAKRRGRLEKLCRYIARPPLATERLSIDEQDR
ncbi:MAG: transposase, partial [Planctomycetota bacterium]|nr:transposase [Planctomycetota bacterium]